MPKTVLSINSLLKKSFFSRTCSWTNKSKILSAGLPGADRIFLKNNKPKPLIRNWFLEKIPAAMIPQG